MAAIPPVARKTLLEWIDDEDDDTANSRPLCSPALAALHARIAVAPEGGTEPLQPPPGLRLSPLG